MAIEIKVPSVGESVSEVEIGEWLKGEGESTRQDETLVMLDSAKTTVELPAPAAGVISKILKQQGEAAVVGEVIGYIESGNGKSAESRSTQAAPPAQEKIEGEPKAEWQKPTTEQEEKDAAQEQSVAPQASQPAAPPANTQNSKSKNKNSFVMPSAERVLHERGVRAENVEGSGPGGRVLKGDALGAEKTDQRPPLAEAPAAPKTQQVAAPSQTPPKPSTPPAATVAGEDEEVVPMTLLRRQIAARLVEAQQTAALLTTFNEIDMSATMAMRKDLQDAFTKKYGIKLGFMSFFVKAAVDALQRIPQINAEIRGRDIVYKNHYDIGVAIGTGKGLVVPVLRRTERMSFAEVEQAIADFGARVKENKLLPDELTGGTFTITNGGVFGSLLSTPIVNPPQSAILGMHTIQERPVARNGEVVIRPMMYVALTYDHRIVDGREAVQFLVRIKECIENPARMLIEV